MIKAMNRFDTHIMGSEYEANLVCMRKALSYISSDFAGFPVFPVIAHAWLKGCDFHPEKVKVMCGRFPTMHYGMNSASRAMTSLKL